MPLLSIGWVIAINPADINYLYVVATMSIWTMWEHRDELLSYMGIRPRNITPAPMPKTTGEMTGQTEPASNSGVASDK